MKFLYILTLLVFSSPLHGKDVETDQILKGNAETIHLIWTEWMGKPKLTYKHLTKETLKSIWGDWKGTYIEFDGENNNKLPMSITIEANGTWSSKEFRPDMQKGHWYLSDGMILLFEAKVSDDADLASALIFKDGKLRLLYADAKGGEVILNKHDKPKQNQ